MRFAMRRVHVAMACVAMACASACVPDLSRFSVEKGDSGIDAAAIDAGASDAAFDADTSDGGEEAGLDAGDSGLDAGFDAGPVPTALDDACSTRWTELEAEPTGACRGRGVSTIASPFEIDDVAITRALDGTLIVAFDELEGPDYGVLRTLTVDESSLAVAAGPSIEPEAAFGETVGVALALATEAPNTHHLAYWLRSDFGNEVRYRTLRDGVWSPVQTLATGAGRSGAVDVAVDSDGRAVVAWHDDESGANATRRERADGSFSPRVTVRTDGDPRLWGPGRVALATSEGGVAHLAFQWSITLAASAPSYAVGATEWSTARTLDNQAIANRASGVGVDLALVGDEVVVAYLDWTAGLGDVRLARFRGGADATIERYLPDISIADLPGRHPLAIESDSLGRLHLVVADASAGETWLQYHRQTLVGGALRWIVDEIARIAATPEEVHMDLVIGADRRPHVVYWDPERAELRYATLRP